MTTRRARQPDPHTPEQRRHNMSRVGSRDTKPEMAVRRGLHAMGFRYRLHDRKLAGTPDLVFSARRAVIFVHGCFWHGHDCSLGVTPGTRTAFWEGKIAGNRARDDASEAKLLSAGWRVLTVWECALRGRQRLAPGVLLGLAAQFIVGSDRQLIIRGGPVPPNRHLLEGRRASPG